MAQLNRDAEYSGRRQTKGPSADSIGATPTNDAIPDYRLETAEPRLLPLE